MASNISEKLTGYCHSIHEQCSKRRVLRVAYPLLALLLAISIPRYDVELCYVLRIVGSILIAVHVVVNCYAKIRGRHATLLFGSLLLLGFGLVLVPPALSELGKAPLSGLLLLLSAAAILAILLIGGKHVPRRRVAPELPAT